MWPANYLLSIGVVTRNRSSNLLRVVKNIKSQTYQPYEIIISDDSDSESSILENRKIAEDFGCRYTPGPRKGLYANRNFVAKQIRGTHLRTMDDDHTFPQNHLEICIAAIEREPETIWTIGEYMAEESIRLRPPHPIPGQLHPRGYSYVPKNLNNYSGISCGATIYPRKIIANGFFNNETFSFGIVYLEFGLRLRFNGFNIRPLTETYIIHHNIKTFASEIQSKVTKEARLYSMLKLGFSYEKKIINKFMVLIQILYEILIGKVSFENVKEAYKVFKNESY